MMTRLLAMSVPMATLLAIAGVSASPAQEPPAAFARVCSKCHDGTRIVEGRRLRSQWEETLDKMVALGATGTEEDFEAILDYLVSVHGRVNVNTAAAPEIELVLHLEADPASAIAKFREKHGTAAGFETGRAHVCTPVPM